MYPPSAAHEVIRRDVDAWRLLDAAQTASSFPLSAAETIPQMAGRRRRADVATEVALNAPLAQLLRYNGWANARLLDACASLTDRQLDAASEGAFGSIRTTLMHMIYGQWSFLARLDGNAQDARALDPRWPGFAALAADAEASSEALVLAAEALDRDSDEVLAYGGKSYRYPKSFFLLHVIAHGVEHRTQICMMLVQNGVAAPDLDGWAYAHAMGLGTKV